ncbi:MULTISPECIES: AraC family transcriptional regulator [Micromonospora]|uniref:AraC family transcriptional regulator n=1 Tax=Micromonospora solifontis TaxID=2487138 RepID=A0ABX9WAW7_9ACTN|nr:MULTISPECIES: AraC family transcriptional regulator [Micromonospora]NES12160.1 helix-turn-helix transcriptional regulator [Micromonospora sp. PPF5-17B]NES38889.1 helix-turn-helix transcriptional regulator [Micromonospora solifontis]NES54357.1 helix-turn-helix transcriptional regulator [Micromonospora sp. PPF5-6]RNL92647.1 AraC family transcriptional regulator [Micromonospora solifontis]
MMIEAVVARPAPLLRPYVDRYLGYREHAARPLIRHEVAGAFVVLILGWGAPLDVTDPRATTRGASGVNAFVAGPFDAYCTTRTVGEGVGVQLLLTPPAARLLLGLPLGELANRAVPVDHLDRWLARLRDDLAAVPDWPGRFARLDVALADRLAVAGPVDRRLLRAWRLLSGSGGAVEVGAVADEVGWSRRHLATVFRREFGLPPKTVGRLVRFQRAYATLGQGVAGAPPADRPGALGWAELAVHCGYYDQSHLIREFREFAGRTPGMVGRPGSHPSNPG